MNRFNAFIPEEQTALEDSLINEYDSCDCSEDCERCSIIYKLLTEVAAVM